ncbi:alpha/beta hydrolase [Halobacillus sp. Marseille-Q1614]|uniref:alpha/beta hydrolase n=1 Tax=Halobacillus sp. Marseille-Q1614 TaxID=2709134 RepID=UPI0015712FDF|nr:alpha/beta hydrolase [Halobacillus sp. Marseille-Q1614]
MFTHLIAKILRLLPNKAVIKPMLHPEEVKEVKEILIETSVKDTYISCYYPLEAGDKKLPVYINLHGGAFIMHSKEMDDPYCRRLANHTGCAVINVDYAKAPEYPFPQPIEQCYEIYQWIRVHGDLLNIDSEKIMIGGQSSGANIAAAVCLMLKERNEPLPLLQVLSCPMLDFVTPHTEKPEADPMRRKYPQAAHFIHKCYVPEPGQAEHPFVSPVLAEDVEGIPRTVVLFAEHDAFSLEAEKYIENLKQAGVSVRREKFNDCYHAFTHLGPKEKAEKAWKVKEDEITKAVR